MHGTVRVGGALAWLPKVVIRRRMQLDLHGRGALSGAIDSRSRRLVRCMRGVYMFVCAWCVYSMLKYAIALYARARSTGRQLTNSRPCRYCAGVAGFNFASAGPVPRGDIIWGCMLKRMRRGGARCIVHLAVAIYVCVVVPFVCIYVYVYTHVFYVQKYRYVYIHC